MLSLQKLSLLKPMVYMMKVVDLCMLDLLNMDFSYIFLCCSVIVSLFASCDCDSMYVEGTAEIISVTEIDTLTECGGLAEVRFDFTPDNPTRSQQARLNRYPTKDVRWLVCYYTYPPKNWLDLVGVIEGSQQRCSFVCFWGGGGLGGRSCGGWEWDFLDVDEESVGDSCEVWEGEE